MAGLNDLVGEGGNLSVPQLDGNVGGSTNKDIMADARRALSGNWSMVVLGFILYSVLINSFGIFSTVSTYFVVFISAVGGANAMAAYNAVFFVSSLVFVLITGPFVVGWFGFFLGTAQEGAARLELLFVGFQRFCKSFAVYFFYSLFVFLWTLLFFIPGIIATFRYAMAFFIIADDEDCGPLEALSRSKEMMKGNKWKFFCLHWRFLGWWLLATIFTFGIGFLWLIPYMQTSFAKFYEDVK
jgi:uncharacterized membrane protein